MIALVQVVSEAKVSVDGEWIGRCGRGFLIYIGVSGEDTESTPGLIADRIAKMRVLADSEGKLNLSLAEMEPHLDPQILLIPNFTLYGNVWNGRRPSYQRSAPFDQGKSLFDQVEKELKDLGLRVETGEFGADMEIESHAVGPVNLIIESKK